MIVGSGESAVGSSEEGLEGRSREEEKMA